MDYPPRIQQLLDKYWSAESTIEEERELKNYFVVHSENTDANMAYFKFLEEEGAIEFEGMLEPPRASVKTISPAIRIMRIAAAAAVLCP